MRICLRKRLPSPPRQSNANSTDSLRVNLATLPIELIRCIGDEILRHPILKYKYIKMLRLVCKSFDRAFAPIVLWRITIFGPSYKPLLSNLNQFRVLSEGYDRLTQVKSITIHSWSWIFSSIEGPYWCRPPIYTAIPNAVIAFTLVYPIYYLFRYSFRPRNLPKDFGNTLIRLQARYLLKVLGDGSFKLPNVRSVNYESDDDNKKSIKLLSNVLLNLPSLTELQLSLRHHLDCFPMPFDQLVPTMQKLHNLRKITVFADTQCHRHPDWLKAAILHNPNLESLALYGSIGHFCLSDLLEGVPADRPLRLQHIRLSDYCYGLTTTVLPHIRSLTSLEISFIIKPVGEFDEIWRVLKREKIYLSKISTDCVSLAMFSYLSCYNGLTSFSINGVYTTNVGQSPGCVLFPLLAQHPNLQRLALFPHTWNNWYKHSDNKTSLLRCTNLRELAFHFFESTGYVPSAIAEISDFASQFRKPFCLVTVEDRYHSRFFDKFVDYCRGSKNPLVQDLGGRIVHEQT
ncbi:hypothetical protein AX17_006047 [Amanita inopinata Kibby_2008]|nr:hypothetical protein AX17_006047 [Amanita inopinata Kibby_2008]